MKKGEVWIIAFPDSDGHEQHGARPAILIADTPAGVASVIPCTANLHALRFPFTLRIDPSKKNGVDAPTIALLFQLRAVDRQRFVRKIGVLEQETIKKVNRLLKTFLEI